jgi:DNA (cytosine-5)-methyltransferase 1
MSTNGVMDSAKNATPGSAKMGEVLGLFAGIGGIELGFKHAGYECVGLCEADEAARAVLDKHFFCEPLPHDVRAMKSIPQVDVLTAGFPCQDLSMAGMKAGIAGTRSSLVSEVFRLLRPKATRPRWLMLENVPYMLHLDSGEGMRHLTGSLERLGYRWAYRVVDARAFGAPQRRLRVVLLASQTEDPGRVLLTENAAPPENCDVIGPVNHDWAYGFYWTEGKRGLGWAGNAVPTIKGGSGLGIPSPPAIWIPRTGEIGTPSIQDAERLQGFPEHWTRPSEAVCTKAGTRWRLIGNAVSVDVSGWVASRLHNPVEGCIEGRPIRPTKRWPNAAWGANGKAYAVDVSTWPVVIPREGLEQFLKHDLKPLSVRATRGFLLRARTGIVRFSDGFLEALDAHLQRAEAAVVNV